MHHWEVTDTFGGEANYSWVKRGTCRTEAAALRAARQHLPRYSRAEDDGHTITLRPPKDTACLVGFVWQEV